MMVPRHVLNLNEIATWFDRLTMSGCAPRNDNRMTLRGRGREWESYWQAVADTFRASAPGDSDALGERA